MSRQTDQVIDDDESETCPLCIEEFDLSDYNFYPCPCGYQICQFCYNNIKTTMNGLCPACRRQYDDKNIRWKQITQEEIKSHQDSVAQQAKKKAALRQKEAAKREADSLSRKHLAGIRVRQKNLVYITGLKPTSSTDALSETLRRDEYFGQYGKIIKVVVSKAKDNANPNAPVGVYVTFETKEAAAKCIHVVDGSQNYDTRLRAQYGTTKYCSAYLRGDTCSNKGCMFLHEPGDENESFSRQDLSSMNVISTQSPDQANMPSSGQPPQPQPPPQQAPQSIAAASQAVDRRGSRDDSSSQADSVDGSGLPTSATWATKPAPSRQGSQYVASSSPLAATTLASSKPRVEAAQQQSEPKPNSPSSVAPQLEESAKVSQHNSPSTNTKPRKPRSAMSQLRSMLAVGDCKFVFDQESVTDPYERRVMNLLPPLFDPYGAARRKTTRKFEIEQHTREIDKQVATQALSAITNTEQEESAGAGSLQLGGEPEDSVDMRQRQSAIRPPSTDNLSSPIFGMEHTLSPTASTSNPLAYPRGVTPQQHQNVLLQHLKSSTQNSSSSGYQPAQSNLISTGHARQTSRYSFANDTTASASVKSVANPSMMNQQTSMMPASTANGQYNPPLQHQAGNQYFPGTVQGPPPGLKTTGTPPVSGGGMFGQGHGFATAGLNYGINASERNTNNEKMRDLMRNRQGSVGSGQTSDTGRRELMTSSFPSRPRSAVAHRGRGLNRRVKTSRRQQYDANATAFVQDVVDHADPSILQSSRMHQNGTGSHANYGAQGQGQDRTQGPSSTSDIPTADASSKPSGAMGSSGPPSRKSTPAVPPGLKLPITRHQIDGQESGEGLLGLGSQVTPMPELGRVSTLPKQASCPATSTLTQPPPTDVVSGVVAPTASTRPSSKEQIPEQEPMKNDLTHAQKLSQPESAKAKVQTSDNDSFPALPKSKAVVTSASEPSRPLPPKVANNKVEKKAATKDAKLGNLPTKLSNTDEKDEKTTEEHTRAANQTKAVQRGKANASSASAAMPGSSHEQSLAVKQTLVDHKALADTTKAVAATLASKKPSETPATVDTALTVNATKPRALRVVPETSSKAASASPPASASSTSQSPAPTVKPAPAKPSKLPSRKTSISSATIPETPAGDRLDDDASTTTSHSASRASSPPPPSRGGPSSSRAKPSTQQKKDRLERLKTERASTDPEPSPVQEDIVHEPIVGRKKKAKKPVVAPMIAADRTESPKQKPVKEPIESPVAQQVATPVPEVDAGIQGGNPSTASVTPPEESVDALKKASSVAQGIIESLQASGELSPAALNFFKSTPSFASPKDSESSADPQLQPPLTSDELDALDSGRPVRRAGVAGGKTASKDGASTADRLLVTPQSRRCLHGLTVEMENRVLELEERIHGSRPPQKYTSRSANPSVTAATRLVDELLQDMASALIEPAIQQRLDGKPQGEGQSKQKTVSPSKPPAYADDALAYLNQFILPVPAARATPAPLAKQFPSTDSGYNEPNDSDPPAISNAIPRTYTTGDPTYSVAGVDVSSATAAPVASNFAGSSAVSGANPSGRSPGAIPPSGQSWADSLPAGMKQLSPLFELGDMPPNMKFDELIGGKEARDALAASLGAASNTLASVASAAAAAASKSPSGSKPPISPGAASAIAAAQGDPAGWQDVGRNHKHGIPVGWQEYVGEMALPQDVVDMGADAIRQAIVASGITGGADIGKASNEFMQELEGLSEGAEFMTFTKPRSSNGGPTANRSSSGPGTAPRAGAKKEQQHRQYNAADVGEAAARALAEIEAALSAGRREVEALEKKMAGAVKKNRKVVGL